MKMVMIEHEQYVRAMKEAEIKARNLIIDKAAAFDWLAKQRWFELENFGGVVSYLSTETPDSERELYQGESFLECVNAAMEAEQ